MKFSADGALRIGTLNGANSEIREEGDVEIFLPFALGAEA